LLAPVSDQFLVVRLAVDLAIAFVERLARQRKAADAVALEVLIVPRLVQSLDRFLENFLVAMAANWRIFVGKTL